MPFCNLFMERPSYMQSTFCNLIINQSIKRNIYSGLNRKSISRSTITCKQKGKRKAYMDMNTTNHYLKIINRKGCHTAVPTTNESQTVSINVHFEIFGQPLVCKSKTNCAGLKETK